MPRPAAAYTFTHHLPHGIGYGGRHTVPTSAKYCLTALSPWGGLRIRRSHRVQSRIKQVLQPRNLYLLRVTASGRRIWWQAYVSSPESRPDDHPNVAAWKCAVAAARLYDCCAGNDFTYITKFMGAAFGFSPLNRALTSTPYFDAAWEGSSPAAAACKRLGYRWRVKQSPVYKMSNYPRKSSPRKTAFIPAEADTF